MLSRLTIARRPSPVTDRRSPAGLRRRRGLTTCSTCSSNGSRAGLIKDEPRAWRVWTDRKRKGKKLSNTDWVSKSDPEAKIAKMQDGTTHLAYKPEHAVDLDTGAVVAAELHPADEGDTTLRAQDPSDAEAGAVGG